MGLAILINTVKRDFMDKDKYINENVAILMNVYHIDINEILKIKGKISVEIEMEETKNGMLTFKHPTQEDDLIYVHSKYDPIKEAKSFISQYDLSIPRLYIVYGIGMGYHIDMLIDNMAKGSCVVVIEREIELLLNYSRYNRVAEKMGEKSVILLSGKEDTIISNFREFLLNYDLLSVVPNAVNVIMPSYEKIYGLEWIREFSRRITNTMMHGYFIIGNDLEDTLIGLKQNFENIYEVIKSADIKGLKNQYRDKPAIIVSAGPSLNKNIQFLKESQGKALILATDATLTTLKNHDVLPDTVSSIERIELTYKRFYEGKDIDDRITLVAPPVIKKEIIDSIKGNKLFILKKGESINDWINEMLEDERDISVGTSAAHICFSFAKHLGANPIIFIGQDLAYTKEGITHANDVEIKKQANLSTIRNFVKDIHGEMIPTNFAFKNFLVWFETEIARDKSERKYIDATEGGAYITGTELMTLKETIKKYCKTSIEPLYKKIEKQKENKKNDYKKIENIISGIQDKILIFSKFRELLVELLKTFIENENKLYKNEVLSEDEIKQICSIFKDIEKVVDGMRDDKIIGFFFQSIYVSYNVKLNKIPVDFSTENAKAQLYIYISMLQDMNGGCIVVEKALTEILNNINEKIKSD